MNTVYGECAKHPGSNMVNCQMCAIENQDTAILHLPTKFTEEDLDSVWQYYKSYLVDILNGDYDLNEAREDLRGLVGSEHDKRKI